MPSTRWLALLLLPLLIATPARGGWFDAAWPCRRTVDVVWPADKPVGNELAMAEVYTDGHALPTAADVRVAADDGHPVPFRLLTVGPGDRVRLAFALRKDARRYAVYFGNPAPPPPPEPLPEVPRSGLLMQTKVFTGGGVHTFDELRRAWDRSGPPLGQTLIAHAFHGFNPFDDHVQYISKVSGTLYAPLDGDYTIAMAVDDEGCLYLDGKPAVVAHLAAADTRYRTTTHLTIGPHDFTLYHVNLAGSGAFSVGWQGPNARRITVIEKQSFGNLYVDANVTVGPLEVRGHPLVGDVAADRAGECYVGPADDDYVLHYRFTPAAHAGGARSTIDFGDGQHATADGPAPVDHVYLRAGVYTVRCTAHAGANTDAQTCRLVVGRDYLHLPLAKQDPAPPLSALVATYDLPAVPVADLPRAIRLHLTAEQPDPATAAADALAAAPAPPPDALSALTAVQTTLLAANHPEAAAAMWDRVPPGSDVRPAAARDAAALSLWWAGDAKRAVELLKPFRQSPDDKLTYAQAVLLAGHADEARPILDGLPPRATGARRAALSGADARTVEFYITEGEADAGDAAWRKWMADFPTDYTAGYAVLLRTKLMQLHHRDAAAAAVAEAFVDAEPTSSYAPQLLDRAAKLLAPSDPAKAAALRQRLKQKYPEDPLSQ